MTICVKAFYNKDNYYFIIKKYLSNKTKKFKDFWLENQRQILYNLLGGPGHSVKE